MLKACDLVPYDRCTGYSNQFVQVIYPELSKMVEISKMAAT